MTDKALTNELRQQAEARFSENTELLTVTEEPHTPEAIRQLVHELEVHQIELEMQNDELREAHAALDTARAHYFDLYDLAPVGYLTVTIEGVILEGNLTASNLLGRARSKLSKKMFSNFIFKQDQDIFYLVHKQLIETTQKQECELRLIKNDASPFWAHLSLSIAQSQDDTTMLRLVLTDITERKHITEALIKSQSQLRTLVNTIPDLIWLKDKGGAYLSCNPSFEKFFGAKEADIIGKTDYDFVDKELADFFQEHDKKAMLANTPSVNEEVLTFADGDYQGVFETIKTPMRDEEGNLVGVLGVARDITNRKRLETDLKEKEERLALATSHNGVGVWDLNLLTSELLWDDSMFTVFNIKREDFSGAYEAWEKTLHPDDLLHARAEIEDAISGKKTFDTDFRILGSNGDIRHIKALAKVFHDEDGKPIRMLGTNMDITERKQAEDKLQLAASVFSHAREGITITDAKGTILDVNDTFTQTTGYSREEAIGQNPRILKSGRQSPEFYADMWKALLEEGYWYGEVWNRRKNGEVYAEMKTISAVHDAHDVTTHYVALCTDITPMKEHQEQLERIAHYDILTNLPNRSLLADRLSQAMLQCSRHQQSLAVVFLDLDHFKEVNDTHGHDVGDELLIALSLRMKEALREGDTLARIGGDEFVAILADLAKVEDCEPVLDRLLLAASEPVAVGEVVLNVSASIGVTLYPQDSVDADQLMRHADQAMYVAKESGKNRYHLFDNVQDDAVKVQRESLEAIRSALDNHQFVLHYQPKVNMRTGTVTGVEALIRWQHPKRGLLNPIEFLPVIENHTMMIEMGEWVIDTALTQISQWQAMGLNLPVNTSVNIAAVQLQQSDFTQRLTSLLAAHPDVEPRYLELEVLETSALDDVQHVSTIMNACMALGVNFSLDDFGTGYSSLTYLRRLPASLIKIDQTFVRDMLVDSADLAIVEGVIGLAKSFKRDVIAEGVETIEHGTALLKLGCDLAQGYGIARPMPAGDIPSWMAEWKPDDAWQS